jgi:hypothetical protein
MSTVGDKSYGAHRKWAISQAQENWRGMCHVAVTLEKYEIRMCQKYQSVTPREHNRIFRSLLLCSHISARSPHLKALYSYRAAIAKPATISHLHYIRVQLAELLYN